MSEPRRPRRIEIPADVAAREAVPDDLDASAVGPYTVPDVARRRRAGLVYVAAAAATATGIAAGLPTRMWILVVGLLLVAAYHRYAGWHLAVTDQEALETANRRSGFPAGHAAAALTFEGVRSRPVWNVLVFSAEDPPQQRSLVRIDGVDATVIDVLTEPVPPEEA